MCEYIAFWGEVYFQKSLENILTIVISFLGKFSVVVRLKGIYFEQKDIA